MSTHLVSSTRSEVTEVRVVHLVLHRASRQIVDDDDGGGGGIFGTTKYRRVLFMFLFLQSNGQVESFTKSVLNVLNIQAVSSIKCT